MSVRDADPGYTAAKSGDADAALQLARRLISEDGVRQIRALVASTEPLILPVVADELTGYNAIPDAMAQILATKLRLTAVAGRIVQTNKVGHTRAKTFQRIVTPASFSGPVLEGGRYILVDDHVGLGGTLANLKGYLEARGGNVIAMTTLTESHNGRQIALRADTLTMLKVKHGEELDPFWRSQFDHGIEALTEIEAQNLGRQESVGAIQDLLAQAAVEARGRGLKPRSG
ncbi:phosphoribosyltransferase [Rhizobium ruizarguesonis]|uniref:phosphoribosyltransferase n=1 Tax=Rhizobium ruizarguesonis TaxID=2081791 RepID=UPI0013DFF9F2|nr:phosphoribosyltransferase [Rhizobium ruizarguesonis]